MTLSAEQLNLPWFGAVAVASAAKPDSVSLSTRPHCDGVFVPGSSWACRPPPVHPVTLAFSMRQVAVSCEPQSVAALTKSNHDDTPWTPSAATLPLGLYCFMRSR